MLSTKKNDLKTANATFRSDIAKTINEKNPDSGLTETASNKDFSEAIRNIQTGLSYKRRLTGDNLDALTEDGIYDFIAGDGNVPTNRPPGAIKNAGMIWVETSPVSGIVIQTYCEFNLGNHLWTRRKHSGSWSVWAKLAVETNVSAQSLLKKTPTSADAISDADGVFGLHNGNFVTRSMGKLWDWIVTHLANGVKGSLFLFATGASKTGVSIKTNNNANHAFFGVDSDSSIGIADYARGDWIIRKDTAGNCIINMGKIVNGTNGDTYIRGSLPALYLQNQQNPTDGHTLILKNRSSTADYGTILRDKTNGVDTNLHLQGGGAQINGSEILRSDNLLSHFPGIVHTKDTFLKLANKCGPRLICQGYASVNSDEEPYVRYLDITNLWSFLVVMNGGAHRSNPSSSQVEDLSTDHVAVVLVNIGTNVYKDSDGEEYNGCKFNKLTLGSSGGTTPRFSIGTVNETLEGFPECYIKVPKSCWANYIVYELYPS